VIQAAVAAPGYVNPHIYQWNATIEQSLGPQTISAGYVGARGRHLVGSAIHQPSSAINLRIVGSEFTSSYDSLQLRYNRRLARRLQALFSYTWSHSIDNLSYGLRPNDLSALITPDINRGSSDFDIRHTLNGALLLNLPAPRTGIAGALLRNWSISNFFFARSAPPTDLSADTLAPPFRRPDLVSGQPLYLYGSGYPGGKRINGDAFAVPAEGVLQGNLGRNVLRVFGAWQIDVGLQRQIALSEHVSLQFRAEAFNVLNHANFASPNINPVYPQIDTVAISSFGGSRLSLGKNLGTSEVLGQLQSAFQVGQPRTCQFALRLTF
jgi:hypothetical protein